VFVESKHIVSKHLTGATVFFLRRIFEDAVICENRTIVLSHTIHWLQNDNVNILLLTVEFFGNFVFKEQNSGCKCKLAFRFALTFL
jgi:hypothetical protein